MANKETIKRITNDVRKAINYHTYESIDVTYIELIGILECIKFELMTDAYYPDKMETDDEDNRIEG